MTASSWCHGSNLPETSFDGLSETDGPFDLGHVPVGPSGSSCDGLFSIQSWAPGGRGLVGAKCGGITGGSMSERAAQ